MTVISAERSFPLALEFLSAESCSSHAVYVKCVLECVSTDSHQMGQIQERIL